MSRAGNSNFRRSNEWSRINQHADSLLNRRRNGAQVTESRGGSHVTDTIQAKGGSMPISSQSFVVLFRVERMIRYLGLRYRHANFR